MSKIENLKNKLNVYNSEELFDIPIEPPTHLYSYEFNNLIGNVSNFQNLSIDKERILESLRFILDNDISKVLNDLRSDIEMYKVWGDEWKKLALKLLEKDNQNIIENISDNFPDIKIWDKI